MAETKYTRDLCNNIVKHNGLYYPISATKRSAPGWPDRLIFHRYWHGLLEIKAIGGIVSDAQVVTIGRIWDRCPGSVYVIREQKTHGHIEMADGSLVGAFDSAFGMLLLLQANAAIAAHNIETT